MSEYVSDRVFDGVRERDHGTSAQDKERAVQARAEREDAAPINPRYAAYARSHGRSVEDQQAQDKIDHPGGSMVSFVFWNRGMIRTFLNSLFDDEFVFVPRSARPDLRMIKDGDKRYDAWLAAKFPQQ